jgi:hypothetical protein
VRKRIFPSITIDNQHADITCLDVRNRAAAYVLDHVPVSARRLRVTEADVREMVEARVAEGMGLLPPSPF